MEVIYINDKNYHPLSLSMIKEFPVLNKIYNILSYVKTIDGKIGILLEEIRNPELPHPSGMGTFEPTFDADRFTTLNGDELTLKMVREAVKTNKIEI